MRMPPNRKSLIRSTRILCLVFIGSVFLSMRSGFESNSRDHLTTLSDNAGNEDPFKIGLLLPVSPENDLLARSALQGAQLAIELANREISEGHRKFELIVRTADGLWGAGSKASVDFVHDDGVLAIVSAVDGRNAHLAEQVASKSHVVQLSTRATEETLSQAFVPWFFRIVPNDRQQSEVLVEEVFEKHGFTSVFLLFQDDYDSRSGAKTFQKMVKKNGYKLSGQTVISTSEKNGNGQQMPPEAEAVVVFGSFQEIYPALDKIKEKAPSVQVFGSLNMTFNGSIGSRYTQGCEGGIFVSSKFCFTTYGQDFKDQYRDRYDMMPNPAASYAFDGVKLMVNVILDVGPDREKIRDALKEINFSDAATGPIRFDKNGNRVAPVFMIRMIKGHPVILNP